MTAVKPAKSAGDVRRTNGGRTVEAMSDAEHGASLEGAPFEPSAKPVRFARLAALLPSLKGRSGSGATFPHAYSDSLATDLYRVAHEDGCIISFEWPSYLQSARTYLEPGRVEAADLETCRKLLTIIVRQERFAEGSISEHIESGFAARVVGRIAELTWTTPAPACPSCAALSARRILRGYPTAEAQEAVARGEVVHAGCFVSRDDPAWRCRECEHEFGRIDELVRFPKMIDVATDILHDEEAADGEK